MSREDKRYKVYVIVNRLSGKMYVGITSTTLKKRFKEHCSKSSRCKAIRDAIQKYEKENFIILPLFSDKTLREAWALEIEYIKLYNTKNKGYNLNDGGEGGECPTDESRQRMSLGQIGRVKTPEQIMKWKESKQNMTNEEIRIMKNRFLYSCWTNNLNKNKGVIFNKKGNTWYGKVVINKIQLRFKDRLEYNDALTDYRNCLLLLLEQDVLSVERTDFVEKSIEIVQIYRKNVLQMFEPLVHTEESKEKNRQAHLGKKATDEVKANISKSRIGLLHTQEEKNKIGLAHKNIHLRNKNKEQLTMEQYLKQ